MEMINLKHGNQVQQLRYDYDSSVYSFEKDIKIGTWIVSRHIKICGPKESIYKYNFKNFFEFVITDVNGTSQVLTWNHNAGDKVLISYWGDSAVDSLPFFFENHPVFFSKDWEDYKYALALNAIKDAISEEGRSAEETIKIIACLVDVK